MSEEKKTGAPAEASRPRPPLMVVLMAVNVLAATGAVGMMIYSKLIYQRPVITETSERARLADEKQNRKPSGPPGSLVFPVVTVNLDPAPAEGAGPGKIHYATLSFTLSTVDKAAESRLEGIRPLIEDRLLTLVGRKGYTELTSVQGRYQLRSQLRDSANQMAKDALVTDVFFTDFVVQ